MGCRLERCHSGIETIRKSSLLPFSFLFLMFLSLYFGFRAVMICIAQVEGVPHYS